MDQFGIGAAVRGAAEIYFRSARRTGRTTMLVESLKTGDRVVFADAKEAQRVKGLCKERGVEIETLVVSVEHSPHNLFSRGSTPGDGRTVFDHSWVESWYARAIKEAAEHIDNMQNALSGYGEAHRKTARTAREISTLNEVVARWGFPK